MSTGPTASWQGKTALTEPSSAAATLLPGVPELLPSKITWLQLGITFPVTDSMDWVFFFSASVDLTTRLTRMLLSFQTVVSTKKAAHLPPHVPWNVVSIPLMLAKTFEEDSVFNKKYLGFMSYSN